jgi:type II secretory pathway pseudopilin PulG
MQRKNSFIKQHSSRSGIAMIMAIAVIVIVSTLMALAISMSSKTSKDTIDLYLYEQSVLLAKSAAEYTLLRISLDNNETNPCNVTSLNFSPDLDGDGTADFYDINVTVKYSYTSYPATCPASVRFAPVTTPEQNGSVLLDIAVSVDDTTVTTEPIRYFRRTIQKL